MFDVYTNKWVSRIQSTKSSNLALLFGSTLSGLFFIDSWKLVKLIYFKLLKKITIMYWILQNIIKWSQKILKNILKSGKMYLIKAIIKDTRLCQNVFKEVSATAWVNCYIRYEYICVNQLQFKLFNKIIDAEIFDFRHHIRVG